MTETQALRNRVVMAIVKADNCGCTVDGMRVCCFESGDPEYTKEACSCLAFADIAIAVCMEEAAAHLWDNLPEIERKYFRRSDIRQLRIRKDLAAEIRALKPKTEG